MPLRPRSTRFTTRRRGVVAISGAALLGGLAWLVLIPAAELQRRGVITYDAYNRLLVVPLVCFAAALSHAAWAARYGRRAERLGFAVAATGAAVLSIGNIVEFYGVLLQDGLNAFAASEAGVDKHWIGSDVGWIVFIIGMLVLLLGGLIAALGLRDARPRWLAAFAATLGPGVLAGNLFGLAPAFLSVPALAAYGAAWIAYGRFLARRECLPPPLAEESAAR